jgi:hypothetical protein
MRNVPLPFMTVPIRLKLNRSEAVVLMAITSLPYFMLFLPKTEAVLIYHEACRRHKSL